MEEKGKGGNTYIGSMDCKELLGKGIPCYLVESNTAIAGVAIPVEVEQVQ
jgi:hypothetical protein